MDVTHLTTRRHGLISTDCDMAESEIKRLTEQLRIAREALGQIVHAGDGCEVAACVIDPASVAEDALIRISVVE